MEFFFVHARVHFTLVAVYRVLERPKDGKTKGRRRRRDEALLERREEAQKL